MTARMRGSVVCATHHQDQVNPMSAKGYADLKAFPNSKTDGLTVQRGFR
jgi:hypothetical protein